MSAMQTALTTRSVDTPSGRISYAEAGAGPVALFVHGVLLNKHLWRRQLSDLSDIRRCIAVDLLAHGDTEIAPDQDVSVTANAGMLREVLDVLKIDQVDLIGNDSGGGIAQIFAALNLERVRTLTLTDCDTHDNWPPEPFKPFLDMAAAGGLRDTLNAMLSDKNIYRSPGALGPAYERPEEVTDDDIEIYLRPFLRTEQRTRDFRRFLGAFDARHTPAIEPQLRRLEAPTLLVWGTDDVYFPVKWAYWRRLRSPEPGRRSNCRARGCFSLRSVRRSSTGRCTLTCRRLETFPLGPWPAPARSRHPWLCNPVRGSLTGKSATGAAVISVGYAATDRAVAIRSMIAAASATGASSWTL